MPAGLRVLLIAPAGAAALLAARADGWHEPFIPSQAQGFWVRALRELGHSVQVIRWSDSLLLPEHRSLAWASRRDRSPLLRTIAGKASAELGPRSPAARRLRSRVAAAARDADLVAVSGGSGLIDGSLVEAARAGGTRPVVLLNGTSPAVFGHPREKSAAPLWDHIFCNERLHALEWIGLGAPAASALPVSACDPEWHTPMPEARIADVAFVGAATSHRRRFLGRFLDALPDEVSMSLAGPGWHDFHHARLISVQPVVVVGDALRRAICSGAITISVQEPSMLDGGSLRNFEATGCGTALIVDRLRSDWFTPDEVIRAEDPAEAAEAAAKLIRNGMTEEVARRGRMRSLSQHTYAHRWRRLLAIAKGEEEAEDPRTLLAS